MYDLFRFREHIFHDLFACHNAINSRGDLTSGHGPDSGCDQPADDRDASDDKNVVLDGAETGIVVGLVIGPVTGAGSVWLLRDQTWPTKTHSASC